MKRPANTFIKKDCTICLEPVGFNYGPLEGCEHKFHSDCLLKFFRKMDTTSCPICRRLDPAAVGDTEENEDGMVRRAGTTDEDIEQQQQRPEQLPQQWAADYGGEEEHVLGTPARRFHELLAMLPEPAGEAEGATASAAGKEIIDLVSSASSDDAGDDDGDENEYRAGDNLTCMNGRCAYRREHGTRKRSHPSAPPPIGGFLCGCGSAMVPPRRRLAKRRRSGASLGGGDAKPAAR